MIEAELKARVRQPKGVRRRLLERSAEAVSVYHDTYYDQADRALSRTDRELRIRIIDSPGRRRCLLTYKDAASDPASGSKPEHETAVERADTIGAILGALGFERVIAFEKHCSNFAFQAHGRQIQATLVRVPELEGAFLEVETLVEDHADVQPALTLIGRLLGDLGIPPDDLTTDLYTDMVRQRRNAVGSLAAGSTEDGLTDRPAPN